MRGRYRARAPGLLSRGKIWIVRAEGLILRRVAIGTPVAAILSRRSVEHDDPPIRITVSDEQLVRFGIDRQARRATEVGRVVAPARHPGLANGEDVPAVSRELVDDMGRIVAHPYVVGVIDEDGVLSSAPLAIRTRCGLPQEGAIGTDLIALTGSSPGARSERLKLGPRLHQVALRIELDDRRRWSAALRFVVHGAELSTGHGPRAMDDPHMAPTIDAETADLSEDPLVRQR